MKKILIAIAALVVLALIVLFGAIPFYVGTQVEKELAGKTYHFKDYNLALAVTSVSGGVRSSAVEFDIKIYNPQMAALAPKPLRDENGFYLPLKGKGVIHHGPVAFGWPIITPFVAGGEAGIRFPDDIDQDLKMVMDKLFGDKAPITVSLKMGLDNSMQFQFSVPDYNGPLPKDSTASLQWGGSSFQVDLAQDGNSYSMTGEVPVIKIVDGNGEFLVTDLRLSGKARKASRYLWLGDSRFSVGSLRGEVAKQKFQFENIEYITKISEKDGNLDYGLKFGLQKGEGKDFSIQPSALEFKIKGINIAVIEDFVKTFQELNKTATDPSQFPMKMVMMLPQFGLKLLENPPQLELTELTVATNHGKLLIQGAVEPAWKDPSKKPSIQNILAGSKARLSLKFSKSLVKELLRKQLLQKVRARAKARGRTLDKAQEESMIDNAITQQMGAVLQQKFILEKGDQYISEWNLDQGVLKNNGEDRTPLLRMFLGR